MARISIPLDALTSRLNLADRFSGVRSQSLATRFSNIKPISEFLDLKRLSKPNNFAEVQTRVNYNLTYFSSNYAVVFVMLSVYSLITNLWLLFDIILVVGGMWAIGKLGGQDLEIGTIRATPSQLYTGLACIAVPVAFISSPIATFLWLIGATGGRPRTPYDVPPWGRPPGGRPGRRNDRQWDSSRYYDYYDRVEELDTDDDTLHGVGLDQNYNDNRFVSDELHFDGIDLGGPRVRRRRSGADFVDDDFTPPSDDDENYDPHTGLTRRQPLQVVYKEKEDLLVERALERIARARALGKPNVKLTRAEIDALERLERNQTPPRPSAVPQAAAPKSKKEAPIKRKPVAAEVRKKPSRTDNKSASNSPKRKSILDGRDRGRSTASNHSRSDREDSLPAVRAQQSSDLDHVHVGRRLPYPQGYYVTGPRPLDSSRQGSRTNSNQSLRQQPLQMPSMPPYQHPYYNPRYASNPDVIQSQRAASNSSRASRPDPIDPDWEPRSRSSSSLVNVPLDHLPYQTNTARAPRFDPSDPRFGSPQRRVASGPAATHQHSPSAYRRHQDDLFLPEDQQPEVMRYRAPSDSEPDDDDDSDYDEGVQVNVSERPGGEYAIQTRSATASNSNNKAKAGTRKTVAGKRRSVR